MGYRSELAEVIGTEFRFLTFQRVRPDMRRLSWHFLALGLIASWMAGIGRYWDTPQAQWWQYGGLGSVVYTFFMAAFLWALVRPLRPENWSYFNVLTFVGMTAPPALLYAIPIERFADPYTSNAVNYAFLLIVATWRVGLLWVYLRRSARLSVVHAFFALTLPLSVILVFLGYLQLTQVVLEGMAGNRNGPHPTNYAGQTVVFLGIGSLFSFPCLLLGYSICAVRLQKSAKRDYNDGAIHTIELIASREETSDSEV